MKENNTEARHIAPADRLESVQEYYFSRKGKEVAAMNKAGQDVISLAIGSPDMPPSKETIDEMCRESHNPDAHGYQPTNGTQFFREALASFYQTAFGVALDPTSEVLPSIGSKEAILHITLAFVNPGEKVLVPNPGYPTYTSLSRLLGAEVVYYDLKPENDWQPDFDQLEAMDLTGVRLLWCNYPHMPTGAAAKRKTLERLVEFSRRHGIVVVNDNPYSFILSKQRLSLLQVPGAKETCIELNSMSKSHNMPGWRIGVIATNWEFISWIYKVMSNIESGRSLPLQRAAAVALRNTPEWHEEANFNVYARRRRYAEAIMQVLGCEFRPDQVGMFLWGRIPSTYASAEELTERVLHEARVFITPGFIFGSNGERYIRISLCAKEDKLAAALERIREVFNS